MRKLILTAALIAVPAAVLAQAPAVMSAFMDANHMMMTTTLTTTTNHGE